MTQETEGLMGSRGSLEEEDPVVRMDRKVPRVSRGYLVLEFLVSRVKRANAACASQPRSEADLRATKCQMDQYKARRANQVLRVHLDLQASELTADRDHRDSMERLEKRVSKESEERGERMEQLELLVCLESLVVTA